MNTLLDLNLTGDSCDVAYPPAPCLGYIGPAPEAVAAQPDLFGLWAIFVIGLVAGALIGAIIAGRIAYKAGMREGHAGCHVNAVLENAHRERRVAQFYDQERQAAGDPTDPRDEQ